MAALTRVCRMLHPLPIMCFEIVIHLALLLLASYGLMQDMRAGRRVAIIYSSTTLLAVYSLCSLLLRCPAIRTLPKMVTLRATPLRPQTESTEEQLQRARAQEEHKIRVIEAEHQPKILVLEKEIRRLKSQIVPDREDRKDSVYGTRTFSWFLHDHDMEYPLVVSALSHIHPSLHKRCIICFADFQYGERVTELPCNHGFHEGCIDLWLKRRIACALCQQELLWVMTVKPRNDRRTV